MTEKDKEHNARIDNLITQVQKHIYRVRNEILVEKYQGEITDVMKSLDGVSPGDIPARGRALLAKVYAQCRKGGGDKEYASKVAWSVVNRNRLAKSDTAMLKELFSILKDITAGEAGKKPPANENTP